MVSAFDAAFARVDRAAMAEHEAVGVSRARSRSAQLALLNTLQLDYLLFDLLKFALESFVLCLCMLCRCLCML